MELDKAPGFAVILGWDDLKKVSDPCSATRPLKMNVQKLRLGSKRSMAPPLTSEVLRTNGCPSLGTRRMIAARERWLL